MSSRKRKHRGQHPNRTRNRYEREDEEGSWQEPEQHWQRSTEQHEYDPALHIVAHEADIERGPGAARAADALEARMANQPGSRLIRLGWASLEGQDVWVDRYDARLLLDGPPIVQGTEPATSSPPRSPSPGWSDLPSDAEDTFFLAPEDIEDYERNKRRRAIDKLREDRMRALAADDEEEAVDEDPWGGSDEEPDEAQRGIMQRTAAHLLTSPNAAQLEMRILANHGSKREFSFLRGRWARAWAAIKAQVRAEKEDPSQKKSVAGLGGLMAYGSDSGDDSDDAGQAAAPAQPVGGPTSDSVDSDFLAVAANDDEDATKEARRARARDWAERRRTEKGAS